MNPPDELKARVFEAILARPSPARTQHIRGGMVRIAAAFAIALGIFAAFGGVRVGPRPLSFVTGATLGLVALALVATWLGVERGGSSLGRPMRALVALAIATPPALVAWMMAWAFRYPALLEPWPGRIGLRCLGLTLLLGAAPLAAFVASRRGTDAVHPYATGAALGTASGAWMAILVELWCPMADPSHVILGHATPIALLALAGLACGRVLAMRGAESRR